MKKLLALAVAATLASHAFAQSCGCGVTITKEGSYDGKILGYKPGQTICLQAGNYKYLYFRNIVGAAGAPIKIVNCGGQVVVSSDAVQPGIQFYDSKYVKLTGSGNSGYQYGIKLVKTPANYSGIVVTGFSSDFEIERTEVSGTGFAGIMIKQDPTCDPATWRGNLTMSNIKVHDNYVHDTGGEGLYVGNSFWNSGMVRTCDGVSKTVFPHNINGLQIYKNTVERTGAEGIQYGCAPNALVYNNTVRTTGVSPFDTYQNNGIQMGGGCSGRLYNNTIQNVPGTGIIIVGHSGSSLIYNNLITDVGESGVFCDNREGTPANQPVIFANNTLVRCGTDGFRLYNDLDVTTLTDNAVFQAASDKLLLTTPGVRVTQQTNYYNSSFNNAVAANVIQADYKPKAGSPLVNTGTTNTYWGITTDLAGNPRPQGGAMDIGAYELVQSANRGRLSAEEPVGLGSEPLAAKKTLPGEETVELKAMAFPSPCVNEVSIRLSNGTGIQELRLYNTQGVQLDYVVPKQPTDEIRLRTGSLSSGGYFFRILTPNNRPVTGRFIRQ